MSQAVIQGERHGRLTTFLWVLLFAALLIAATAMAMIPENVFLAIAMAAVAGVLGYAIKQLNKTSSEAEKKEAAGKIDDWLPPMIGALQLISESRLQEESNRPAIIEGLEGSSKRIDNYLAALGEEVDGDIAYPLSDAQRYINRAVSALTDRHPKAAWEAIAKAIDHLDRL